MVKTPAPAPHATATPAKGDGPPPGPPAPGTGAGSVFYHCLDAHDVVVRLESDAHAGLDEARAKERLAHYGPNELEGGGGVPIWKVCNGSIYCSLTMSYKTCL